MREFVGYGKFVGKAKVVRGKKVAGEGELEIFLKANSPTFATFSLPPIACAGLTPDPGYPFSRDEYPRTRSEVRRLKKRCSRFEQNSPCAIRAWQALLRVIPPGASQTRVACLGESSTASTEEGDATASGSLMRTICLICVIVCF